MKLFVRKFYIRKRTIVEYLEKMFANWRGEDYFFK